MKMQHENLELNSNGQFVRARNRANRYTRHQQRNTLDGLLSSISHALSSAAHTVSKIVQTSAVITTGGLLKPLASKEAQRTASKIAMKVRDPLESAAVLAANYYLPGSSIFTAKIVSKGSQKELSSNIGKIAQVATGAAGFGIGSQYTGIPASGGWQAVGQAVGVTPPVQTMATVDSAVSTPTNSLLTDATSISQAAQDIPTYSQPADVQSLETAPDTAKSATPAKPAASSLLLAIPVLLAFIK